MATETDIPLLRELADRTWRQCYAPVLSPEQMDYMLARMYGPDVIAREMKDGVIWEISFIGDEAVGFHSCTFDKHDRRLKLNKLYVPPEAQGRGLGRTLLRRVRALAEALRAETVWLQVNKRNTAAIGVYQRAGYTIERAAVFDIGGGFVMDDFVMTLPLSPEAAVAAKDSAGVGA